MRKAAWLAVIAATVLVSAVAVYAQGYGGGGSVDQPQASASGAMEQLKAAQTHATFAAQAEVLAGVRSHLSHVVNCLEGARGADFNAREMNPCQGMGNGILPDLTALGSPGAKALGASREANTAALAALKVADLAQAKAGASKVATLLSTAMKDLPK